MSTLINQFIIRVIYFLIYLATFYYSLDHPTRYMTTFNVFLDVLREWQDVKATKTPTFKHLLIADFLTFKYFIKYLLPINLSLWVQLLSIVCTLNLENF